METASLLSYPGIGVELATPLVVERVTAVAQLVAVMLKHDWSLSSHLQPITTHFFHIIRKLSPLPHPPSLLLAACLRCLTAMASHAVTEVWQPLTRTGFLPHFPSSTSHSLTSVAAERVPMVPGHYGQLLSVFERPRGTYPITMATLDLLLAVTMATTAPPTAWGSSSEYLASVVYTVRELCSGLHKWRYRDGRDRDQLCLKLLQLCHAILSKDERGPVWKFVSEFLLRSGGTGGTGVVLSTLATSIHTASRTSHRGSRPLVAMESLTLAFSIIDLLLESKNDQSPTPLEQALATQSAKRPVEFSLSSSPFSVNQPLHLVAVIASYIHHRGDPKVPAGAVRLLTRLAQAAPMSLFACLAQEAAPLREAYVNRLTAIAEDTELKVAILDLVCECVGSQPGLLELFLCIRSSRAGREGGGGGGGTGRKEQAKGKDGGYVLEPESCLHAVLLLLDPDKQGPASPPRLLSAAVRLLRTLWHGRHDAALIALRQETEFWRHLTHPLFTEVKLEGEVKEAIQKINVCNHVMHIIAMETYYVMPQCIDPELSAVLSGFSKRGRYHAWVECLGASQTEVEGSGLEPLLAAQLQLARAWSSLLLVGASLHADAYGLADPTVQSQILADTLSALRSQLSASDSATAHEGVVAIATELSSLYMILFKKWSKELKLNGSLLEDLTSVLDLSLRLEPGQAAAISAHLLSSLLLLIRALHSHKEHVEPRFLLGVVPCVAMVLQSRYAYPSSSGAGRPEPIAVYLLAEVVRVLCHSPAWLPSLHHHSLLPTLLHAADQHCQLRNDLVFLEAVLSFFLIISHTEAGAESLLAGGVSRVLCVSLPAALTAELAPPQPNQPAPVPAEWGRVWLLAVHLTSSLGGTVAHHALQHMLNFAGVYQERILGALDIFHAIRDPHGLEDTRCVCQLLQVLARFKQQWHFSLPSLHDACLQALILLTSSTVALLGRRAALKHAIRTTHSSGFLPGVAGRGGCGQPAGRLEPLDDAWVTSSSAFAKLQDSLLFILSSSLSALHCYSPSLEAMLVDTSLDLKEFPPLFSVSLTPPTIEETTPPSLGILTACLSTGLALLNKLEPHKVGTPSPNRTPGMPRPLVSSQRKAEYLHMLEVAVAMLLSQAVRYLVDPATDPHCKQVLRKGLAGELRNFSQGLLLNFTRRGAPLSASLSGSLRAGTPAASSSSLVDSSSAKMGSISFSDTAAEKSLFRLADSFARQFFR